MNDTPTSPVTSSEIETVFADPTPVQPARSMMEEWRRVGAFLKRPRLDERAATDAAWPMILRIYALDMTIMLGLVLVAGAVVASGVELPTTALADIELSPFIILMVIAGAPLIEELIFRGWLPGRPSQIVLLAGLISGASIIGYSTSAETPSPVTILFGLVGIGVAVVAAFVWRSRPTPERYARHFRVFFWLSTLAFALVHLTNFSDEEWLLLLPLVLPQFFLGMLLGYLRVQIGLWAAIVLHAAHNATALGISALAAAA